MGSIHGNEQDGAPARDGHKKAKKESHAQTVAEWCPPPEGEGGGG